ncbi:tail fiber protein [Halomonas denitrificans]|nr:tail fiber protein [Halomonas denitrificans]
MSEPFIAEIRIFAGNFAPRSWAFCDGQLLPIAQNTALFSLIGTIYGGDGRTTTALPNLQGRAPMHPGTGPGLTPRSIGQNGGVEQVTITEQQMPNHRHTLTGSNTFAGDDDPAGQYPSRPRGFGIYTAPGAPVAMAATAATGTGGGQPHNNMQPYLAMSFIIALQGLYPSRS